MEIADDERKGKAARTKPTTLSKVIFSIAASPHAPSFPVDYAGEFGAGQCGEPLLRGFDLPPSAGLWSDPRGLESRRRHAMAFDDLKAELALLINQMENQPEDPHELYLQIREKLNEMRAFGMPLPDDLVAVREGPRSGVRATESAPPRRTSLPGGSGSADRSARRCRSTSDRRRKAAGSGRPSR